jgi:hypothetical protein
MIAIIDAHHMIYIDIRVSNTYSCFYLTYFYYESQSSNHNIRLYLVVYDIDIRIWPQNLMNIFSFSFIVDMLRDI